MFTNIMLKMYFDRLTMFIINFKPMLYQYFVKIHLNLIALCAFYFFKVTFYIFIYFSYLTSVVMYIAVT